MRYNGKKQPPAHNGISAERNEIIDKAVVTNLEKIKNSEEKSYIDEHINFDHHQDSEDDEVVEKIEL
jgi:hypothetical protein